MAGNVARLDQSWSTPFFTARECGSKPLFLPKTACPTGIGHPRGGGDCGAMRGGSSFSTIRIYIFWTEWPVVMFVEEKEAEKVFRSLASFAGSGADRSPHIRQWVPVARRARLGREGGGSGSVRNGRSGAVLVAAGCIPIFVFFFLLIGLLNQEQAHLEVPGSLPRVLAAVFVAQSLRVFVVSASCWP